MKIKIALSVILLIGASCIRAQDVKWSPGSDLSFLKNERTLGIEIFYDSIVIDDQKEPKYLELMAKEYESDSPGKGEKFTDRWENAKKLLFPKYFMMDFVKLMARAQIKAGPDIAGSKYILRIYPLKVMTGAATMPFSPGVPCSANFRILIVERARPDVVIADAVVNEIQGRLIGHDYDQTFVGRYKMAFRFLGIILGRDMKKRAA